MSVVISGLKLDNFTPTKEKKSKLIARLHWFTQKKISKKANQDLEWTEEFEFTPKTYSATLRISIRDKGNTSHSKKGEFMGRASITVDTSVRGKVENWYQLKPRKRDPSQQIIAKLRIVVNVVRVLIPVEPQSSERSLKEALAIASQIAPWTAPLIQAEAESNAASHQTDPKNNAVSPSQAGANRNNSSNNLGTSSTNSLASSQSEDNPEENIQEILQKFQAASQKQTKAREWEIKPASLELDRKLGEGATSTVYKGTYNGSTVAVKVVKDQLTQEVLNDFRKEADLLLKVQGEGVVACYGAYTDPTLLLVLEYCSRGSVDDILEQVSIPFDWDRVFDFAEQSARALHALHSWEPPIVHRDFKPSNLLVTENWTIKIADFGLSRFVATTQEATLKKVKGTVAYTAPEVLSSLGYLDKSDVYSFGVSLWEFVYKCIHGVAQKPYREYTNLVSPYQVMVKVVKNQLRPTIPPSTPLQLSALISTCWSQDPNQRPSIKEVLDKLEEARTAYINNKQKWNEARISKA